MNLKDIQKVIGTPKENRDFMVKALLLDLKLKCKQCDTAYPDWNGMNNLTITHYADAANPRQMICSFVCKCGHGGAHTFKPNPFMAKPSYTYSHKGYGY
jgi:hypothetical protein